MTLFDHLMCFYQKKALRAIDLQFAHFIARQLQDFNSPVVGWAAIVSFELGKGHVCIDVLTLNFTRLFDLPKSQTIAFSLLLEREKVLDILPLSLAVGDGLQARPLVLEETRLYLHRYWLAEKQVAEQICKRAIACHIPVNCSQVLNGLFEPDIKQLKNLLAKNDSQRHAQMLVDYFDLIEFDEKMLSNLAHLIQTDASDKQILASVPDFKRLNWQKVAAAVALSCQFSVISGGPGTGKTTTVAKLLAALISCNDKKHSLDIKLVAPTGKAANRLTQSIASAVAKLPVSDLIREQIPQQASTIHRLLGALPNRVAFRHHQANQLHLDVLVVDEASMVDLALMAHLLLALPCHARVILLGDRDQLASVEAGSVLGDICAGAKQGYSKQGANTLSALTGFCFNAQTHIAPVSDGVCLLKKSYRFHANSGIGQLAYAINSGERLQLDKVLEHGFNDICLYELTAETYSQAIDFIVQSYQAYLHALSEGQSHLQILSLFAKSRMLCALTKGPFGVAGLNHEIEKALSAQNLIKPKDDIFYPGRPIMIMQNDHGQGLYNGDIGIVVQQDDSLRVIFDVADGSVKCFLPSRLPLHQTAYAMTVHKSQGSEFEHVALMLPATASPVMTKELVYTGITRAKNKLDVFATRASLVQAMERKMQRSSGLTKALGILT